MKNDYLIVSIDKLRYAINTKCIYNILEIPKELYVQFVELNEEASISLLGNKMPLVEFSQLSSVNTKLNENVVLVIICLHDFKYALRIDNLFERKGNQIAKMKMMAFEFKDYVFDVDHIAKKYNEIELEELYANYQLYNRIAI